jgi:hypothetical protein
MLKVLKTTRALRVRVEEVSLALSSFSITNNKRYNK